MAISDFVRVEGAEGAGAPVLVDSHCHPHFPQFEGDVEAVRRDMRAHGVGAALAVATSPAEFEVVRGLARRFPGEFFAACAVHPNHDFVLSVEEVVAACRGEEVVAVGETGLDYFAGGGVRLSAAVQKERFAVHIEAALALGKPLVVHTRDSLDDALGVLAECGAAAVGGVLHCFLGDAAAARRVLEAGFCVSFTGIVTFKNAAAVREAVAFVPSDRYMVETDAPYLAPVPHRGRRNTPGWVRYVAAEVAVLRGCSEAEVWGETTGNFERLFGARVGF